MENDGDHVGALSSAMIEGDREAINELMEAVSGEPCGIAFDALISLLDEEALATARFSSEPQHVVKQRLYRNLSVALNRENATAIIQRTVGRGDNADNRAAIFRPVH